MSPDGTRVVYVEEQPSPNGRRLYSVSLATLDITELTGDLGSRGTVAFTITPDSRSVVYLHGDGAIAVPIDGGPEKVLAANTGGDFIQNFAVAPDGRRFVYTVRRQGSKLHELFSVPLDGGDPVRLDAPQPFIGQTTPADTSVMSYEISADGRRVVFQKGVDRPFGDNESMFIGSTYTVPIEGGPVINLGDSHGAGEAFMARLEGFTPNGDRIFYWWSGRLYSVNTAGGMPVPLGAEVNPNYPWTSTTPDGQRIIYLAKDDEASITWNRLVVENVAGGEKFDLFLASEIDGNPPPAITLDGSRVVCVASKEADEGVGVFSISIAGDEVLPLSEGEADDFHEIRWFHITASNDRVVFGNVGNDRGAYSVPLSGGETVRLDNPSIIAGALGPGPSAVSPDGDRFVYHVRDPSSEKVRLFGVSTSGGVPLLLNGEDQRGYLLTLEISEDGKWIVYHLKSDLQGNPVPELYRVPITGGDPVRLNHAPQESGWVRDFVVMPNGTTVVYWGSHEVSTRNDLYLVDALGGPPTKLSIGDVFRFIVGETSVVFVSRVNSVHGLYSLSLSGGPPRKISDEGATGLGLQSVGSAEISFALSPDESRVVYNQIRDDEEVVDLFSVPIEGGEITKLSNFEIDTISQQRRGEVRQFKITQDSSHVLYQANNGSRKKEYVYWVPIAGGSSTNLGDFQSNRHLFAENGDDRDVSIDENQLPDIGEGWQFLRHGAKRTPDGGRILVSAVDPSRSIYDLFALPADGGLGRKLGRFNESIRIEHMSFDGDYALIMGSMGRNVDGIFLVPLDGEGFIRRINRAEDTGGKAVFSPDSQRIFFTAHTDQGGHLFVSGELNLEPPFSNYDAYAEFFGLSTSPDSDEDGDNVANVLEYLTGRDPRMAGTEIESLLSMEAVEQGLATRFKTVEVFGSNLELELERSRNLQNGAPDGWVVVATRNGDDDWVAKGSAIVEVVAADEGLQLMQVTDSSSDPERAFYRLKATLLTNP